MMNLFADILIVGSALLGHIWASIVVSHYVHSARLRYATIVLLTYLTEAIFLTAVVGWGWWFLQNGFGVLEPARLGHFNMVQWLYLVTLALLGAVAVPLWVVRRLNARPPEQLTSHQRRTHDVVAALGHWPINPGYNALIARLPGNQSLKIDVVEQTLEIPRLHPALDQLSIVHLTDTHFGPCIRQSYYEEVVRLTNLLDADLIAITGDVVDEKQCVPWISETLGKLQAELGVYVIFGNHDWMLGDLRMIRDAVDAAGLCYLGGSSTTVSFQGQDIVLAGNELPWVRPAADPAELPTRDPSGVPLRVLLAHSPDQFAWARRHDFDLMLAGHTHGGQLALPRLGPIFTASRTGTAYSAGTFFHDPPAMHVSRGVSGSRPLRYNCPPEITKLTLCCPASKRRETSEHSEKILDVCQAV